MRVLSSDATFAQAHRASSLSPSAEVEHLPPGLRDQRQGRTGTVVSLIGVLCAAAAIVGMARGADFPSLSGNETTDDAYIRADQITISSHIEGYVESVPVQDNKRVSIGDVVARLRDDDYKARLASADADLEAAQSDVQILTAEISLQDSRIVSAEAVVSAARADLTQARLEHARQQALASKSYSPVRNLEAADAAEKRFASALEQRLAELTAAKQSLDVLKQRVAKNRQIVVAKEAARTLARINLGYTRITSPINGQLAARSVLPGEYVVAGTKIALIVPLPNVWVVANFREAQMAHMRPGQKATFTVDGVPGRTFHGEIDSFEPLSGALQSLLPPDNATGNFTKVAQRFAVKIVLAPDQPDVDRLRPGMSVVATVRTADN
jgi:membrane fusion protein (multidrug efflux system)